MRFGNLVGRLFVIMAAGTDDNLFDHARLKRHRRGEHPKDQKKMQQVAKHRL